MSIVTLSIVHRERDPILKAMASCCGVLPRASGWYAFPIGTLSCHITGMTARDTWGFEITCPRRGSDRDGKWGA
jgi:hypothetical protein